MRLRMKKAYVCQMPFFRSILAIAHNARARLLPLFSQFLENFSLYRIHLIAIVENIRLARTTFNGFQFEDERQINETTSSVDLILKSHPK